MPGSGKVMMRSSELSPEFPRHDFSEGVEVLTALRLVIIYLKTLIKCLPQDKTKPSARKGQKAAGLQREDGRATERRGRYGNKSFCRPHCRPYHWPHIWCFWQVTKNLTHNRQAFIPRRMALSSPPLRCRRLFFNLGNGPGKAMTFGDNIV